MNDSALERDRNLIYQTVGYADHSKDPASNHVNQAVYNALRVPFDYRLNFRLWLPDRVGLADKFINWVCTQNGGFTWRDPFNVSHAAVWLLEKSTPKQHNEYKDTGGPPLPDWMFEDNNESNWWNNWAPYVSQQGNDPMHRFSMARDIYQPIFFQVYEYARTLNHDYGHWTTFGMCVHKYPKSFMQEFKDYFGDKVVVPMCMVLCGTQALYIKHKLDREKVKPIADSDAYIQSPYDKTELNDVLDKEKHIKFVNHPYYRVEGNSLHRISKDDAIANNIRKPQSHLNAVFN